jgi:hypothetical protein
MPRSSKEHRVNLCTATLSIADPGLATPVHLPAQNNRKFHILCAHFTPIRPEVTQASVPSSLDVCRLPISFGLALTIAPQQLI